MSDPTKEPSDGIWPPISAGLRALWSELRSKEAIALLVVTLVLVTRQALGSAAARPLMEPLWELLQSAFSPFRHQLFRSQLTAVVLQLVVPALVIWLVHRERLQDYGLALGRLRLWGLLTLCVMAVQLPVVALVLARDPVYRRRYPSLRQARAGGGIFWLWESSRAFYMLSWEFLFRGYLLFALEKRLGYLGCLVQMLPFALMHIVSAKPVSEVYFTIVSGILSGALVLVARSAWPVILLHAVGAILLDILIVYANQ